MYYNQGGVLAMLLKGGRVAQFRLLSDAVGRVSIGDQPASFVSKTFGTIHELLAYYKANEITPMLPILRDCIPLLGKGAGIKRKDKNRGNGIVDLGLIRTMSHSFIAFVDLSARRGTCSTRWPCLSDADGMVLAIRWYTHNNRARFTSSGSIYDGFEDGASEA